MNTILQLICMLGLASLISSSAMAQSPVVTVNAQHYGGQVVYSYSIVNNGPYKIAGVWIGYDSLNDNDPNTEVWELNLLPAGLTADLNIPPASVTSPVGWEALLVNPEETPTHAIEWHVINTNSPRLLVGQTLSGMSIKLDRADNSHVTGHAYIKYGDRPRADFITVPLQRLDTTPPTLTVTLTPSTLPSNGKHVLITATISAKDDYDPSPEIKLESITPSEMTELGDIRDAHPGTDGRQFMLKAESRGKNKAARFYTVIYSATDASGNKATASATVTVSHDERGHDEHGNDDHRDDKDRKDKDDHKRDH